MTRVLRFDGTQLLATHDPLRAGQSPELADSFLFRNGRVRARDEHRHRFFTDLNQLNPKLASQLGAFYRACAQELSDEYEAFPRFDLVNDALWLRVRPVPDQTLSVSAVTASQKFEYAARKGPNIAAYALLNASNQCETIRLAADGSILEGVTSALLWWHKSELHFAPRVDRVTSTTEQFVLRTASTLSIPVRE